MKTIIARFTELKENIAGTERSEFEDLDYNKVDKALKTVGVQLKDSTGQFRDLDQVFLELSSKWNTLDRNSQRYIATIAAGSRQQSRFIAMMENYDRTLELVETAQNSAGKSSEQFAKYQDTVEYKLNQLKTSWEQLRVSFTNSDFFKNAIDALGSLVDKLNDFKPSDFIALGVTFFTVGKIAIKNFISGLQTSSTAITKAFSGLVEKATTKVSSSLAKKGIGISIVPTISEQAIKQIENKIKALNAESVRIQTSDALKDFNQLNEQLDTLKIKAQDIKYKDSGQAVYTSENGKERLLLDSSGRSYTKDRITAAQKAGDSYQLINEQLNAAMDDKQAKEKQRALADARGQLLGATLATAMTSAMVAVTTSEDPMEAVGTVLMTGLITLIPQIVSMVAAGGEAATTAAVVSTGGVALIFIAIAAAITGIAIAIKNMVKEADANSFANRMSDAKKAAEDAKQAAEDAAATARKSKESYENIKQLKKEFEELNAKQVLTTEEQEKYNELVTQIYDEYPEIISYYDEVTGELRVQNQLWDDIIAKQKEVAIADLKASSTANAAQITTQGSLDQFNLADQTTSNIENIVKNSSGIEVDLNSDYFGKLITGTEKIEDFERQLSDAMNYYNTIDDSTISSPITEALYDNKEAIVEAVKGAQEQQAKDQNDIKQSLANNFATTQAQLANLSGEEMSPAEQKLTEIIASKAIEETDINIEKLLENRETGAYTFFDALGGARSGPSGNELSNWDKISKKKDTEIKDKSLNDLGISYVGNVQELLIKAKGSEEAAEEFWQENLKTAAGQKKIYRAVVNQAIQSKMEAAQATDALAKLSEGQKNQLNEVYAAALSEGVTQEELNNLSSTADILGFSEKDKAKFLEEIQKTYDDAILLAKEANIPQALIGDWSSDQLNAYANWVDNLAKTMGQINAENFARQEISILEQTSLDPNKVAELYQSIDWQSISAATEEEFSKTTIEKLKEVGIENAETIYQAMYDAAESYGILDVTISTTGELNEFITQLKEINKIAYSQQDTIISVITNQAKEGEIALSDYYSLEESLIEMGENIKDYTTIDASGKIKLNTEDLTKLYETQTSAQKEQLEQQKERITLEKAELQAGLDQLNVLSTQLEVQSQGDNEHIEKLIEAHDIWRETALLISKIPGYGSKMDIEAIGKFSDYEGKSSSSTAAAMKSAIDEQIESIKTQINAYDELLVTIEKEEANLEGLSVAQLEEFTQKLKDTRDELKDKADETAKAETDALKAVQDAQQSVIDKQKELNEAIGGSESWNAGIDDMYNYTTNLERVSKMADRAKQALDDLQDWDDPQKSMQDYLDSVRQETIISEASIRVREQAITNGQNVLSKQLVDEISKINKERGVNITTQLNDLYTKVGDRYNIDLNKLNQLELPDKFRTMIVEEITSWNKNLDEIESIQDKKLERQKQFNELYKNSLTEMVNLQDKMKNTLKEKYSQEIDDLESKYSAMEDADNEYLDALEEAMEKERRLRERENQWNDLTNKERKLALMQRDTSGGNLVETRKLEQEVQTDREKLLDNAIDDVITGLKEIYELQQESRNAEIEYRKALLDEGMLMQEVTAALANINTADDLVAWFYQNTTDLSNMSAEQIKLEEMGWRELFDAKLTYLETSQADFNEALDISEQDIVNTIANTSELLTSNAETTLSEISSTVDENIRTAQQSLTDALDALNEKMKAYNDAVKANKTAQDAYNKSLTELNKLLKELSGGISGSSGSNGSTGNFNSNSGRKIARNTIAGNEEWKGLVSSAKSFDNKEDFYKAYSNYSETTLYDAWEASRLKQNPAYSPVINKDKLLYPQYLLKYYVHKVTGDRYKISKDVFEEDLERYGISKSDFKKAASNYEGMYFYENPYDKSIIVSKTNLDGSGYTRYKTGGLVDFTGPAWVDGKPGKPEAFLSSEDTKRIGEAAQLLSEMQSWNKRQDLLENITNTIVGDTIIEVNVNVENVSSDYDVDQAVERVKQDIVDAANYTGSNIIIRR